VFREIELKLGAEQAWCKGALAKDTELSGKKQLRNTARLKTHNTRRKMFIPRKGRRTSSGGSSKAK